jgi:hypothetical protein
MITKAIERLDCHRSILAANQMAVLWPFVAVVLTACGGNHNNAGNAITPPTANVSVGQQQPFEIVFAGNEVNSSFDVASQRDNRR